MTKDEALKLALEALEIEEAQTHYPPQWLLKAITAIKEALAQPEQEPVAKVTSETGADITMSWWHEPALPVGTPLYTAPPQRKPLTDEDLRKLADKHLYYQTESYHESGVFDLSRAIEAAHGIKENT